MYKTFYKKWLSVMLTALLLFMFIPQQTSAITESITLAKWDFSQAENKLGATSGVAENLDKMLSVVGPTNAISYVGGPTSGISVPNASPWTNNPSYWQVSLSTKSYETITLSSKQYGSSTGPKEFKLQYSLDGTSWVDVPGGAIVVASNWTSGTVANLALPSEVNNQDLIYVRWLKTSETAINGSPIGSGGTNRIGEIEFKGEVLETTHQPDPNAVPGEGKLVLGGEPLANLTFSLYSTGENQVWYDFTTDENGVFTHNLPDGDYKIDGVWVEPTWYVLGKTFTIQDGLVNGLDSLVIDALEFQQPQQWNVVGTLLNDGTPMENIIFSIHSLDNQGWYDTKTDASGKFHFDLSDGAYQVDGIWDAATNEWYVLNQVFTVANGQIEGGTELPIDVAKANHPVNVTGLLKKGNDMLSDLTFSIRTLSGEEVWYDTKTDENGHFGLYLPNGSYLIEGIWEATAGKWHVLQKEFTVTGEMQLNLDVLTDGPSQEQVNVTGVLKKGNNILPHVVFSIHTASGEEKWYDTMTDENGHFTFVLPDGDYMLEGIWDETEGKWYSLQKSFTVSGTEEWIIDVLPSTEPHIIPAEEFSGTATNPKVYPGDVIVDAADVAKLEHAIIKGNFTLIGNTSLELVNVTVEGETIFED